MFFCIHLALAALELSAQRPRVFGFTSVQVESFRNINSELQRTLQGVRKPSSLGGTMVSVSGNFGGVFSVDGIGTTGSTRSDEYININTNQALSLTAANFTILYSGGSPANTAGSITYEMQLYAGTSTSVGAALTGAASGAVNMFNGGTLVLSSSSIPSGGNCVLRFSRTLNLTQYAEGATTYTASGAIDLTIN